MTIAEIKNITIQILQQYPVSKAALFGSYARGDTNQHSDIDILIELKENISLLTFIEIKLKLEDTLHKKVDLVEYKSLKPLISKQILAEQSLLLFA